MTIPGYDTWKLASPPEHEPPGEACDRCGQEIGNDFAIKVSMDGPHAGKWGFYCEECAFRVERCSECDYLRCICDER